MNSTNSNQSHQTDAEIDKILLQFAKDLRAIDSDRLQRKITNHARIQVTADNELVQGSIDE